MGGYRDAASSEKKLVFADEREPGLPASAYEEGKKHEREKHRAGPFSRSTCKTTRKHFYASFTTIDPHSGQTPDSFPKRLYPHTVHVPGSGGGVTRSYRTLIQTATANDIGNAAHQPDGCPQARATVATTTVPNSVAISADTSGHNELKRVNTNALNATSAMREIGMRSPAIIGLCTGHPVLAHHACRRWYPRLSDPTPRPNSGHRADARPSRMYPQPRQ